MVNIRYLEAHGLKTPRTITIMKSSTFSEMQMSTSIDKLTQQSHEQNGKPQMTHIHIPIYGWSWTDFIGQKL